MRCPATFVRGGALMAGIDAGSQSSLGAVPVADEVNGEVNEMRTSPHPGTVLAFR
jgi:hypothetical protein